MKEIKAYKISDGKIYEDLEEAQAKQNEIDFVNWYYEHKLYDNYEGTYCGAEDVVRWIIENKDVVMKILNNEIKLDKFIRDEFLR